LSRKKLKTYIALTLVPGLGARRILLLAKSLKNFNDIFNCSRRELRQVESIGEASALAIISFDDWEEVDRILELTEQSGVQLITIEDVLYPPRLKQIFDPPPLLWIKGNPEALKTEGLAVVGTRNYSPYGKKSAEAFTKEITEAGLTVYSGLAHGIDAIAHRTCLENSGTTVAVLGSGIDKIYPANHKKLVHQIVDSGGAVISEFPPGTKPDGGNFPIRNRVVSGLSLGVFVIESGVKGGSMITAEIGLDQNREVFAIPHPVNSASGTGCNWLIKNGHAKLVQHVNDILEELPAGNLQLSLPHTGNESPKKWKQENLSENEKQLCELLDQEPLQIDKMSELSGIPTSELLVELLQLEMKGLVHQKAGKIFELL